MHVLVTRPKRDGEALKSRLERHGWRAGLEPLIDIVPNAVPISAIENASGLIVTSRNALDALALSPALPLALTLPLLVVGPGTAAMALELGFRDVFEGSGTGADLVPEIARRSKTDGTAFIYLAGDVKAFDLSAALARQNVDIETLTVYQSVAAKTLTPQTVEALQRREFDVVTLMSPRTANTWGRLISGLLPRPDLSGITYVCLSQNVSEALKARVEGPKILIAARPNLEELFVVLKRLAARPEAE
jgi:uroporphyrinogen-III synthase